MPVFGLNNGMVPIVSYNYGAARLDRVKRTVKLAIIAAVCIMAVGLRRVPDHPRHAAELFQRL